MMGISILHFTFCILNRKVQELQPPADSYLVPFNNSKGLSENKGKNK